MTHGVEQTVDTAWLLSSAVVGLAIGSFVNVVIERVPAGHSIVEPPSHCTNCAHPIRYRHNVPVVSWLLLRGKCYDCGVPIAVRHPLIELSMGALFVALTWRMVSSDMTWALGAYLYVCAIGVALSMIDVETKLLPNRIVLPSYFIVAALLVVASLGMHESWPLIRAAIGAAAMFAFYFVLAAARPGGMGFGDVKLAGLLGAVTGYISWSTLVVGAFGAFVLGAVVGVALAVVSGDGRKTAIPFGPFMTTAAMLAIFAADPIAHQYLRFLR